MTKYAKCSVCGYTVAIPDEKAAGDYVCPVGGTTLEEATRTEYMVTEKSVVTFVVAASDSLHKERADYVCDGVDDQVEIQAAIDALLGGRGKVLLLDGVFNISNSVSIKDYLYLELQGKIKSSADIPLLVASNKHDFVIDGGVYDGQRDAEAYTSSGIEISSISSHFKLKNIKITQTGGHGLYISSCHYFFINDCSFIDTGSLSYPGPGDGIREVSSHSYVISNCLADECAHDGFDLHGYEFVLSNSVAKKSKGDHSGIIIHGGHSGVVANNIATYNEGDGIRLENAYEMTVVGNYVSYNEWNGIWLIPLAGSVSSCVISSNTIVANNEADEGYSGIRLGGWLGGDTHDVDYNLIVDNKIIRGGVPRQVYGIDIHTSGKHNTITSNVLQFSGWTGLVNNLGSDNIIRRNIGYKTENTVLSGTFAIDGTGVKTVTIPHGLAITPQKEDCQLQVVEETNVDDWGFDLLKVDSVAATNVTAKIHVSSASATGGATAKLTLRVGEF